MIAGFLRAIKIAIGDDVVQVASDKQVNFSRASTATYINKSGELKTAEINEPRFECDGLLIEGQRTNYMLTWKVQPAGEVIKHGCARNRDG